MIEKLAKLFQDLSWLTKMQAQGNPVDPEKGSWEDRIKEKAKQISEIIAKMAGYTGD